MNMAIKPRIRTFIIDNFLMGKGGEQLADDASLLEAGVLDSTGVLELVAFIEDEFGMQVTDEEMLPENLDSLTALELFVLAKATRGADRHAD